MEHIPADLELGSPCLQLNYFRRKNCHRTVWENTPEVCEAGHKQPPCEEPDTEPVKVVDDCPTCNGSMDAGDYREYGHCYACRLVEWEVDQ